MSLQYDQYSQIQTANKRVGPSLRMHFIFLCRLKVKIFLARDFLSGHILYAGQHYMHQYHVTGNQKCQEKVLKFCMVFKVLESWVIILEVLPKGFENCICTLNVIGIML